MNKLLVGVILALFLTTPIEADTTPNLGAVGGYDSGPIVQSAAVANSSHAGGTSIGGLMTFPIARIKGGSGIITNFLWVSSGGSTGQIVVRVWDKNPSNTTCTDNAAFSGSAVDDANLIAPPTAVTPAAPAATTGDSKTYGSLTQLTWDYKNLDTTRSNNLYMCVVTVSTDTADENTSVSAMLSGPQN